LLLKYPHKAKWTLFQTRYFSENLIAPEIETGTSGTVDGNSDHYTTLAVSPLSLLISCKFSFPIFSLKMSSLPTLA
jgi:hypothetical protein